MRRQFSFYGIKKRKVQFKEEKQKKDKILKAAALQRDTGVLYAVGLCTCRCEKSSCAYLVR